MRGRVGRDRPPRGERPGRRRGPSRATLAAFGQTADGVLAIDGRGRIVFWNQAAERLLGRTASEAVGRPCYEVMQGRDVHGNVFCHAHCPVLVMARRRELPHPYDVVVQTKDGSERWINVSTVVLPGRRGPTVVHLFRDAPAPRRPQAADLVSSGPDPGMDPMASLTRRERDVLRLMTQGAGTRAIAQRLVLSPATVRSHTQSILTKLGVHSRLQAVALALRHRRMDRSL